MNIPTIIALTVIGLGVLLVIWTQIKKRQLAKLTLSLSKKYSNDLRQPWFAPGDTITGTCTIRSKQDAYAKNIQVSLWCVDLDREPAQWTVFRQRLMLQESCSLCVGQPKTYTFSLTIPRDVTQMHAVNESSDYTITTSPSAATPQELPGARTRNNAVVAWRPLRRAWYQWRVCFEIQVSDFTLSVNQVIQIESERNTVIDRYS